jgi:hypothetical protein
MILRREYSDSIGVAAIQTEFAKSQDFADIFRRSRFLYTIPPQQSVTFKGPVLLRLTARITCSPKAVLQDLPVAATRAMSMPFMPSVVLMAFHFLADLLADIFRRSRFP